DTIQGLLGSPEPCSRPQRLGDTTAPSGEASGADCSRAAANRAGAERADSDRVGADRARADSADRADARRGEAADRAAYRESGPGARCLKTAAAAEDFRAQN